MQESEVINVRLPSEVTNNLDKLLEKKLFTSRAELIRTLLREYAQENKNSTKRGNK